MTNNNKQKLELTWIGKNNPEYDIANIEPRILEEKPNLSYGDPNTENMIIHGDNLLALKALLPEYEGKIKCVYNDPPYNTGNAFEHYDDSVEHSTWLSLMKPRLELLRMLLSEDGSIYVQIDNNEHAYLCVILNEVFGRNNFVQMISVKRASPAGFKVINPGPLTVTDYIYLYAKNKQSFNYYPQRIPVEYDENYDLFIVNQNEDPVNWKFKKLVNILYEKYGFSNWKDAKNAWGQNWKVVRNSLLGDLALEMKDDVVSIRDPHKPSEKIKELMAVSKSDPGKVYVIERESHNPIYIYAGGSLSFYKDKLRIINGVLTPTELLTDFWSDINFAGIAKEGGVQFKNSKKPEMLIGRVLDLSTKKGDLVLDSFLGSGTTAAVAHKKGRKYIGIEMGEHAYSHVHKRMKSIVDGTDQSGISKAVGWQGGGGFKFYELAPSFVTIDEFGNPVIDSYYNDTKLIKAMCKLMNFTFQPSQTQYWKHGVGQGKNYLYVTTQLLTSGMIQQIAAHLTAGESLIITPKKFEPGADKIDNRITIKKIPQSVLKACHFGKKEYLLPLKESAMEEIEIEDEP